MATPMQPVNEVIPMASAIQSRGTSRALVLCGRSITNCCAHTAFIAGYGFAFTGLGISIWYQSILVGVFSAIVAVPIGVTQCFWSRYSNVANAAENVDEAASGAREAAERVQRAAITTMETSANIVSSANTAMVAADSIQVAVRGMNTLAPFLERAQEIKESSEVMAKENAILKEELEELKGVIVALIGIIHSFRASLAQLEIGIKAGAPLLDSFIQMQGEFDRVAKSLQEECNNTTTTIKCTIAQAAQMALDDMQVMQKKNRDLSQEMCVANSSLEKAVAHASEVSERTRELDASTKELLSRLQGAQRENESLKDQLQQTLIALEDQRKRYEDEASAGVGGVSPILQNVREEKKSLEELIAAIRRMNTLVSQPPTRERSV